MTGGIALMTHGMDQVNAQRNADISYMRQKELMKRQNMMDLANVKSMPSLEVEGLRMAGFNPAMVAGAGTKSAPTVSQGNADMPQTLQMDAGQIAQLELVEAQKRNIDAQTAKIEGETDNLPDIKQNIKADTSKKYAEQLLTNANKDKVDQEYTRILNENNAFEAENEMLKDFGEVMANKWKTSDWYKKLGPDTQRTIDAIADGSLPLTVGGLRAVDKVIHTQKDLSDSDRAIIDNAFANTITEAMFKDPKVMSALSKMPEANYENVKAKTAQAIMETLFTKLNYDWTKDKYNVYHKQDPDYLYAEYQKNPTIENMVKWLTASANDKLGKAYDAGTKAIPSYIGGKAVGKGLEKGLETGPNRGQSYKPQSQSPLPQPDPDIHGQNEWNNRGYW